MLTLARPGLGDAMASKPVVGTATCAFDPLDHNMELADLYRVIGTLTLFTAVGRRLNGALALNAIEAVLAGKG